MVKLDVNVLRYMTKEEFRVLTAVEMLMKNHEIVPVTLIETIAGLRGGGAHKLLSALLRNKLIYHDNKKYDGYTLTYAGYDYLALKTLTKRDLISGIAQQIGVGKESDIYIAEDSNGRQLAVKFHRLGRTSFRAIKAKRDYHKHRQSASWLYLSRLAALKEFAFMKALHENGFNTPIPVGVNRHCVLMTLVDGCPMYQVREFMHPSRIYNECLRLICRLAEYGLIHCDFNEYNLLINDDEELTLIDFPQMVSISHPNAQMYFERDVECIRRFFSKRCGWEAPEAPSFNSVHREHDLDVSLSASGFTRAHEDEFNRLLVAQSGGKDSTDHIEGHDENSEEDEGEDDEEEHF